MPHRALLIQLERSIADAELTTAEKQTLVADLRQRPLRPDQLSQLRNHAFALVLERARQPDPQGGMPALVKWLSEVVKVLDQARSDVAMVDTEVWFSPGTECRDAILRHLLGARRSLDICVFTIADDELSRAILKTHGRGVAVRIISDNDKRFDAGSDIAQLADAGIAVALDDSKAHMHHKFALVDQRWLLNGSFNWTRSASTCNDENLVVTNDPQQLRSFAAQFETLWARFA